MTVNIKQLKRVRQLALSVAVASLIMGCNQSPQAGNDKATTSSSATSTTMVASSTNPVNTYNIYVMPSYPPYSLLDEKGNLTGFNPDIIKEIAKRQGLAVNLVPTPMNAIFDSLDKSNKGLIVSAISRSPEREAKYELSSTYGYGQDAIVTKADNTAVNTFEDLKNVKVGVQEGSASADDIIKLQGENSPNTILKKTTFLSLQGLARGELDAVIDDKGLLQYYVKSMPDLKVRYSTQGDYFAPYEMVMVGKKGDKAIIDKVNAGLKAIVADGTYAKIYEKWYGVAPTPEQLPH